jgi:hypothetical protein
MDAIGDTDDRTILRDRTTVVLRENEQNFIDLPERLSHRAGFSNGDTILIEVLEDTEGATSISLRKVDPEQAWYWEPAWQEGAREADLAKAEGRSTVYTSVEAFLASFE